LKGLIKGRWALPINGLSEAHLEQHPRAGHATPNADVGGWTGTASSEGHPLRVLEPCL